MILRSFLRNVKPAERFALGVQGTSLDELQAWQMAPYVEAVLSQPRSRPLLRAAAKLYKCALSRPPARTVS